MSNKNSIGTVQIGKNGLTESFIEGLRDRFKSHQNIKISVLRSSTRDKKELKEMNDKILESLGKNYSSRVIGYTIVVKKWRKDIRA